MAKPPLLVPACPPKAPLRERPLLSPGQSVELAQVFDISASDARLRLLHALILVNAS